MQYTVNLDAVWNLPITTGYLVKDGAFCAIGLVLAAALGADNIIDGDQTSVEQDNLEYELGVIGFDADWATKYFDRPIELDGEEPEIVRERCVRQILQKGLSRRLFKIADTDLRFARELKAGVPCA